MLLPLKILGKVYNASGDCCKLTKLLDYTSKNEIDITGDGGIIKTILKEGSGPQITSNTLVTVHYKGTLLNGTEFYNSRTKGAPFMFTVGKRKVILGLDKGVASMKKGEVCILTCLPEYAYGNQSMGLIPANSKLQFEIELLNVHDNSVMIIICTVIIVVTIMFFVLNFLNPLKLVKIFFFVILTVLLLFIFFS
jgi:FK506-binding protein 4/5